MALLHRAADVSDADSVQATSFPLYYEGHERTRFAYAIFLLNKVTYVDLLGQMSIMGRGLCF